MTEKSLSADPLINVIEQDVHGFPGAVCQLGGEVHTHRQDAAAMDAVSARRRREFDEARARLLAQAIRIDADVARQPDVLRGADAPLGKRLAARVPIEQPPERVRKRYLRAGNQYFLKDAPYQLAFEDLGPYLVTEHNRPDVVESMVDMVAAKSWQRIRVSGHEAFRSEVWLQSTLIGIEVSGYAPKAADLARLTDARQARQDNRIEADASMPHPKTEMGRNESEMHAPTSASEAARPNVAGSISRVAMPHAEDHAPPPRTHRQGAPGDESDVPMRYAGELRDYGGAPYQNNPARSASYYVVLRDATGDDNVLWGVDLERAVQESRAEPGQQVTLENLGRQIVTVKVPILDDHGVAVGEEEKDVYRNSWQVDVVQRDRLVAESATSNGRTGASDSAKALEREEVQERSRSTMSDEDRVLHLAVLAGAMKEQGFSARSITRVQQRAKLLLDAFGREAIPVPRPKVFDPRAPSERDRRARSTAGRVPAREIEHTPGDPSPAR